MNYRQLLLAVLLLVPGVIIAQTAEQDQWDEYWEASIHTGYGFLDDGARPGVDDGPLLALSISRFFSRNFSLSFEIERIFSDTAGLPPGVDDNFELNTASLMGRFYTPEHSGFRGFGLVAIGLTDHSGVIAESSNLSFAFGGGVRYQWTDRFSSRLQLLYRRDTDTIIPGNRAADIVLTTGLNYRWGN